MIKQNGVYAHLIFQSNQSSSEEHETYEDFLVLNLGTPDLSHQVLWDIKFEQELLYLYQNDYQLKQEKGISKVV
jgi:hypothetical protein